MLVRIRLGKFSRLGSQRRQQRRLALTVSAMLAPASVMALVLAVWRIAADLEWTQSFAIQSGPLAHWGVWLGVAAFLQLGSRVLTRYGNGEDAASS